MDQGVIGDYVNRVGYEDILLAMVANPIVVDFLRYAKSLTGKDAELAGQFVAALSLAQSKLAFDAGGAVNFKESGSAITDVIVLGGLVIVARKHLGLGPFPVYDAVISERDTTVPVPPSDNGWMDAYPKG